MSTTSTLISKLIYVDDFQKAYINLQKCPTKDNNLLRKICLRFRDLAEALQHKEPGIFKIAIKWFSLYLNLHVSIDPWNEKFLKEFEKTIPTAISYIIGCLQYKTKEISNYHSSLLNILEDILRNAKPCIIKKIVKLETGTIASLWNPIDYAGDFNTQLKALKILALFLKHLDTEKQNEELKSIKWTNLNLFQDKLKTIVQETNPEYVLQNTIRELLNNYNMNLSKTKTVYSFYCKSLVLGNKLNFYQPLNMEKFWIDINSCPKTLSFNGRFKLHSRSKIENIAVSVKVKKMELEKCDLFIYFCQPEFSKYSQQLSKISDKVIKLTLSQDEEQRLKENNFVLDYFNQAQNQSHSNEPNDHEEALNNDVIDPLEVTDTVTWPESPKTSRISKQNFEKHSIRSPTSRNSNASLRTHPIQSFRTKRKFFSSHLEDVKSEEDQKKGSNKKPRTKKPSSTQPNKKQVGKVLPIIDLTYNNAAVNKMSFVNITDNLNNGEEQCIPTTSSNGLTHELCSKILKNVSDIYNVGDTTYAEPCQSYRTFKTQPLNRPVQNVNIKKTTNAKERKKKMDAENEMTKKSIGIRKQNRVNVSSNKENISPGTSNNKRRISPQLLGTEVPPKKKSRSIEKANVRNDIEIDLTSDSDSGPYKEPQSKTFKGTPRNENKNKINSRFEMSNVEGVVRTGEQSTKTPTTPFCTPNSNITTPRPTSAMNISDLNDSEMELALISKNSNSNMGNYHNEELRKNVVDEILNDWNINSDVSASTHKVLDEEQVVNKKSTTLDLNKSKLNIILEDIEPAQQAENKQHDINAVSNNLELKNFDENVYLRESIVLQRRDDIEDSDSSDNDEDNCINLMKPSINLLKNPDFMINEDIVIMHNTSSNINQNHHNKDLMWNTPDRNCMIVRNVSTKTTTGCQLTPNTVITRQTHMCTKESVLVADTKQKTSYKSLKARKALTDLYNKLAIDKNPQSLVKIINKNFAPEKGILKIDNNNNTIGPCKNFTNDSTNENQMDISPIAIENVEDINLDISLIPKDNQNNISTALIPSNNTILIPTNTNHSNEINKNQLIASTLAIEYVGETNLNSSLITKACQDNTITALIPAENKNLIAINKKCSNKINENRLNSLSVSIKDNAIEPLASSTIQSSNIDYITESRNEYEINTDQRLSLQDIENANNFISSSPTIGEALEYGLEIFESDVSKLVNNYEVKIKLRLENARRQHLTNITDMYKQKICEITESVLKKSEEQKTELELHRKNMERLITQMEWQFQIFMEKSKEYDNYQEIMEQALDALNELDINERITTEYNALMNQLNTDDKEVMQEVWSDYMNERTQKFHNSMQKLSKI